MARALCVPGAWHRNQRPEPGTPINWDSPQAEFLVRVGRCGRGPAPIWRNWSAGLSRSRNTRKAGAITATVSTELSALWPPTRTKPPSVR